jgi:hypothetical protein
VDRPPPQAVRRGLCGVKLVISEAQRVSRRRWRSSRPLRLHAVRAAGASDPADQLVVPAMGCTGRRDSCAHSELQNEELRRVFLLMAALCFVGSWFWRLHVKRGQYYIFLTLLLCLDVAAVRNTALRTRWLGIPIGIALALRPISCPRSAAVAKPMGLAPPPPAHRRPGAGDALSGGTDPLGTESPSLPIAGPRDRRDTAD